MENPRDEDLDVSSMAPSKSQKKRDMIALQDVGEALLALSVDQLKHFDLPEELLTAVLDAKRIPVSKHTAMRRQRQYIGRLMRGLDAAPIEARLASLKAPTAKQNALHHLAERWRERLLSEPPALRQFVDEYTTAPEPRLEALIAGALSERAKQSPPRKFRELYQAIHAVLEAESPNDA